MTDLRFNNNKNGIVILTAQEFDDLFVNSYNARINVSMLKHYVRRIKSYVDDLDETVESVDYYTEQIHKQV